MAAGLGFKDFTTGEVLTAADVDGYLMQGIWVFASAAARDAAVTSPQEGNFAFLKDTNTTTYYTGSAWTNLDTTGMVNPMTTTGDTIYSSSGSTPARLGIGSTGDVLTVAGGVPSWAAPAGGGGMTLISTTTLSGASISLTSIPQTYNDLMVVLRAPLVATSNKSPAIRINGDSTSNRHFMSVSNNVTNATFDRTSWPTEHGQNNSTSTALVTWMIYDYTNTSTRKLGQSFYQLNNASTAANIECGRVSYVYNQTGAITSLDVFPHDSGNWTSGTCLLYGVK